MSRLIIFITLVALLIGSIFLVKNQTFLGSKATSNCSTPLLMQISADGKNWATSVNLPSKPTKYYLKATSNGQPCSTQFDARAMACGVDGKCTEWRTSSPWRREIRTDVNGIARVDFDNSIGSNDGKYTAQFRPYGSNGEFSNLLINTIGKVSSSDGLATTDSNNPTINFADYYKFDPGDTFIYSSVNNIPSDGSKIQTGTMRLQVESEMNWCGIRVRPLRFTKDNIFSYLHPSVTGFDSHADTVTRWMLVSPDYHSTEFPSFDNYYWGLGAKRYHMLSGAAAIKDIGPFDQTVIFSSTTGKYPAYYMGDKQFANSTVHFFGYQSHYAQITDANICPKVVDTTAYPESGWKIRMEKINLNIKNENFSYNGDAIRVDYFEAGKGPNEPDNGMFNNKNLLRESWYFAKGIGLVKIEVKHFNLYGNMPLNLAKYCSDDSDCYSDAVSDSQVTVVLKNYYHNPAFNIQVSADGVNYANSISTTKAKGYYLKLTNSDFTGYLESKDPTGRINKWSWVDKGVIFIPPTITANLNKGNYTAQFRLWTPNDVYPAETRLPYNSPIPWSNSVTVTITE